MSPATSEGETVTSLLQPFSFKYIQSLSEPGNMLGLSQLHKLQVQTVLSPLALCFMLEIRGLGHRGCANIMCTGQDSFESETVKFKTIVGTLPKYYDGNTAA